MLDRREAQARADRGAMRAAEHADRTVADWTTRAIAALAVHGPRLGEFMVEQVREAAKELPPPPDARAWGTIIKAAKAAQLVEFVRYEAQASVNCHGSPKAVWRWIGVGR